MNERVFPFMHDAVTSQPAMNERINFMMEENT